MRKKLIQLIIVKLNPMLAYLKGQILKKGKSSIILLVGDIGYKVFVNEKFLADLNISDSVELFIHHHVREDAVSLFGFNHPDELEIFELLLGVSGIGPKSALGVLAVGEPVFIKDSIAGGDADVLTKVSGIGKKTAERVVMELRDKMASLRVSVPSGLGSPSSNADEIDALIALGYSTLEAREALKGLDPNIKDSRERIRAALKKL